MWAELVGTVRADRFLKWTASAAGVILTIITLLYLSPVFDALGRDAVSWVYDVSTILAAAISTVLAFLLWRASERGELLKLAWGSLAVGLLLWTVGETLWDYYDLARRESPTLSVADIAWGLGYIPLLLALFWRYRSLQALPNRKQLRMTLVLWGVLAMLMIVLAIAPMAVSDTFSSRAERFVAVFYPLGDLLIVLVALLSVLALLGGKLSVPVLIITSGFLVVALSDMLFSYTNWQGSYAVGGINTITAVVDVTYFASYVLIAFGVAMQARLQRVI